MKSKNLSFLGYCLLAFAIICALLNIYVLSLKSINLLSQTLSGVAIIASLLGVYYCAKGFSKKVNVFYKLYMLVLALFCLFSIFQAETGKLFLSILCTLATLIFVLLALYKNLGENASKTLIYLEFVVSLILLAVCWTILPGILREGGQIKGTVIFIFNYTRSILSAIAIMMVYAKYEDKKTRGTK